MPAITDDMVLPFTFLAIARMTITAVVDGGADHLGWRCDATGAAERRLGLADRLVAMIRNPRAPGRSRTSWRHCSRPHPGDRLCGYEDASDLDRLAPRSGLQTRLQAAARHRTGPVLAADAVAGRKPARPEDPHPTFKCAGRYLATQPTCRHPQSVTSDIDDTVHVVPVRAPRKRRIVLRQIPLLRAPHH